MTRDEIIKLASQAIDDTRSDGAESNHRRNKMTVREVFASFLRGADNGTNHIHQSRAAVLAHASRALTLAGPKGRLP